MWRCANYRRCGRLRTHCITLTHCNTLQHTTPHCNALPHKYAQVRKLEALEQTPNAVAMKNLLAIHGIGLSMAEKLVRCGISSIKDLVGKTVVGDVKLSKMIQTGVLHHEDIMRKIPRAEISEIAQEFLKQAKDVGEYCYLHVLVSVCVFVSVCVCVCVCTSVHIYSHMCVYIYTHIYM